VVKKSKPEDPFQTSTFSRGFDEGHTDQFEADWEANAAPYMPRRGQMRSDKPKELKQ